VKGLQSLACVPSQKGLLPLYLQPHHATFFGSVIAVTMGRMLGVRWDPSQQGWFCDRPQAHHATLRGSSSLMEGPYWATRGLSIRWGLL